MLKLRDLEIGYPNHLFLEISDLVQKQAWNKAQFYSTSQAQCQAYLNYLCWQTFVPWLENWLEKDDSKNYLAKNVIPESSLWELWEFFNGSIINFCGVKLALIPSDTTNIEEFDIPQEWVDIPQWQVDYYVAIQVNFDVSEKAWMRVLGCISDRQLQEKGNYSKCDRIYYIDRKYLEEDITEMLLSFQDLTQKKQEVVTTTELSLVTNNKLLEKLGDSSVYYPRLAISFSEWKTLITNPESRHKLYQKRTSSTKITASNSQTINLRQWLDNLATSVETGWQTIETLFTPIEPIPIRGERQITENITKEAITSLIKLLQPNNPEQERIQAAGVLGKIGKGYPEVTEALIELLSSAKEEDTRWEAALSLGKIAPKNIHRGIQKGKLIDLSIQLKDRKIALVVSIMNSYQNRVGVWIQLKPISNLMKLPPNLQLKIISEGETRLEVETRSDADGKSKDRYIQLRFTPPSETKFQVQVSLNDTKFTEYFDV